MRPKVRDTLLTLFGVAALIVYVLACRPSFSPDGARLVLPVMDTQTNVTYVVAYDLKRNSMQTVFVSAPASDIERRGYTAQWLPDGKHIVVNGLSSLVVLPLGAPDPIRLLPLEESIEATCLEFPAPVIGRYQFLLNKTTAQAKDQKGATVEVDKRSILRVNLDTLETKSAPMDGEAVLAGNGGQLFYLTKLEDGDEVTYEIGRLDTEELTRFPWLQFREKDTGEPTGFMTPNKSGSRVAIMTRLDDAQTVLLVQRGTLEKTITAAAKDSGIRIGNAEWSVDEKTLYVAYTKMKDEEKIGQFGVLEVPLTAGPTREVPLFNAKPADDDSLIMFQIALSADGRQIAATSACLGKDEGVRAEERALYLVDLSDEKRQVTKISLPQPPISGSLQGEK